MNCRNSYFADVFSRELDRWKTETKQSQEDFAIAIGLQGKNMISKYRSGKAYPLPETLENICTVLGVEKSIFYPETYEDKFHYDIDFRNKEIDRILDMEESLVGSSGINWNFWNYFWETDIANSLFPLSPGNKVDLRIVTPKRTTVSLNKEDLTFVKQIQDEVEEYITLLLMKKALKHRLGEGSDTRVVQVLFEMAKDLICNSENATDTPKAIEQTTENT